MLNGVFKLYKKKGVTGGTPVTLLKEVRFVIEAKVEQYLVKRCKEKGWLCLKFVSPGHRAVPDRLILIPNGYQMFVELKRPGGKPRPDQVRMIEKFRDFGQLVHVVDSKEKVDNLLIWGDPL
jgi:hypothetical protein